ncbi:MAG: ribokinase [Candidatus Bipolaricaulia bacterium]
MSAKIAVVGSYNVGLTVQTSRPPSIGETVLGGNFSEGPGGKGSNQAIAAARLGAEVHFIGCVGTDRFGDDALRLWDEEGVHAHVRRDDVPTGAGVILLFSQGDNAIVVAPGANATLTPDDIDRTEEAIASCHVLLLQLEIPAETALYAAQVAKAHGVTVILNPAPAQALPRDAYRHIDVLTPNESEAHLLLGEAPDAGWGPEHLTRHLHQLGTQTVVLTQGKAGALIATAEGLESARAPTVRTVDPTGAGDAFNGALAVALAEGEPLSAAVQWACYAGAYCATKMEVIPGLAHRDQLETFIHKRRL